MTLNADWLGSLRKSLLLPSAPPKVLLPIQDLEESEGVEVAKGLVLARLAKPDEAVLKQMVAEARVRLVNLRSRAS